MSRISILLAEDSSPDIYLVEQALTEAHIEAELIVVEDAPSLRSALARMGGDAQGLDLALVDLNLPRANGTELISILRQSPGGSAIPVVVMTSSDSPADRAKATALGLAAYFRKPSDLDGFMRLGQLIRKILDDQAVANNAPPPNY